MTAARTTSATRTPSRPLGELRIRILHVPHCPLVGRLRIDVELALESIGTMTAIEEIEGPCLSPTLLIDGAAIDGYPSGTDPACRIDLPTRAQIAAALLAAGIGSTTRVPAGGDRE